LEIYLQIVKKPHAGDRSDSDRIRANTFEHTCWRSTQGTTFSLRYSQAIYREFITSVGLVKQVIGKRGIIITQVERTTVEFLVDNAYRFDACPKFTSTIRSFRMVREICMLITKGIGKTKVKPEQESLITGHLQD
jgi:hypothetical protein